MQAVIQTGGKQYLVKQGDKLLVEKLEGEPGAEVVFGEILLVTGDTPQVGTPHVKGMKVTAKIVRQEKADKIIVYKYKRRKGYHKTQGHRQNLTRIEITALQS